MGCPYDVFSCYKLEATLLFSLRGVIFGEDPVNLDKLGREALVRVPAVQDVDLALLDEPLEPVLPQALREKRRLVDPRAVQVRPTLPLDVQLINVGRLRPRHGGKLGHCVQRVHRGLGLEAAVKDLLHDRLVARGGPGICIKED